jgi:hypothetical protein
VSAATRSRTPDRLCADAVELAQQAAKEAAYPQPVGRHLGVVAEGDRVVTHLFESGDPAYRGWHWNVTVARAARARYVTIDEVSLAPGDDALLAPEWLPWSERLRPGDLSPGDLLPSEEDDPRLEPGVWDQNAPPPNSVIAAEEAAERTQTPPARGDLAQLAEALGLARARVLSRYGLREAAERWEDEFGERSAMAQGAPASCVSCGFLVPVAGSLRQEFGVCANEFSPADGRVVSLRYGCGAHSEAAKMPRTPQPPPPVIDHVGADALDMAD